MASNDAACGERSPGAMPELIVEDEEAGALTAPTGGMRPARAFFNPTQEERI